MEMTCNELRLIVIILLIFSTLTFAGIKYCKGDSDGIEYHPNSEPVFTLDGETLIKNIMFWFEKNGEIIGWPIGNFNEFGVSCEYTMRASKQMVSAASGVECVDDIYYTFRCELETPSSYVCPLSINLDNWATKVIMENFEENINGGVNVVSPFALSGNGRGIVVLAGGDYISTITKEGDVYLRIYSNEPKTNYESNVHILVYPRELNISDISEFGLVTVEVTIGPEEAAFTIKEFFSGNLIGLDPKLPYANIELKIVPGNENFAQEIELEYESLVGKNSEVLRLNEANNAFYFSGQVKFFGSSWLYPFDTYLSELKTENDISFEKCENVIIDVPGHRFLKAEIAFENNTISIKIQRNGWNYLVLAIALIFFYVPLCLSVKHVQNLGAKKMPPREYIIIFQATPFAILFIEDLMPIASILFISLLIGFSLFWAYFLLKRFIAGKKALKSSAEAISMRDKNIRAHRYSGQFH